MSLRGMLQKAGIVSDGTNVSIKGILSSDSATPNYIDSVGTTASVAYDFINAYTGKVITTGDYSSLASKGVTLVAANNRPVSYLFDDAGAALAAADYRAVLSRVLFTLDQTGQVTVNAIRGQIKMLTGIDFSHADAITSCVQGYMELEGTGARSLTGRHSCLRAALEEGASGTTTVAASSILAGLDITLNSTRTYVETGTFAGIYIGISGGTSTWANGIFIESSATDIGLDVGAGATGMTFTGAFTNAALDFSDVVLNHSGSSGPVMMRAGSYGSPVTSADPHQSGMIRLYGRNSALTDDGTGFYDRGLFVCLKSTGAKGLFPIAGLAEVETTASGDGPTAVMAGQFISHLLNTGSKLANSSGTDMMCASWFKITAIDGATCGATSKKAAVWLDNQMYGNNAAPGEEYTIFTTTGGLKPDAFVGFETTSSGWSNLFYFDETAYNQEPVVSGDKTGGNKDYYLKVNLNGTAYALQLYTV